MIAATLKQGAGFLLGDLDFESLTTPERLTEEQRMLRETTRKFIESEVIPRLPELEQLKPELSKELLRKAAALG
ncbi:acyl-CoA dehydrogenase family protein, partial [Candidatus Sumerlaeota bacterium]|nr:acyl-CoA dehydrogenase family protein [Candidatus Sumerlaeota bacterium]